MTAERPSSLFADIANTTFLAILALWLGGLASFVVLRAIPARVLTSMKPSWRLAARRCCRRSASPRSRPSR